MSLSKAVQQVWDADSNRLQADVDYTLNVQEGKKPWWKEDDAPDPLFSHVDESIWHRPTYKRFAALLDNYHAQVGKAEIMTAQDRTEINSFLDAVMQTAPMQLCHEYCHAHRPDRVSAHPDAFSKLLHKIWFELYRREHGGELDSSGFEHVFVGEIHQDADKKKSVIGFHNWINFYKEEQRGHIDYRGYIKPKSKTDPLANSNDHLLTIQFFWNGVEKDMGTMFIGSSPEFELAIYTMCFLCGGENTPITLDTGTDLFELEIVCKRMARDHLVGTSYPIVKSHHEEQ